MTARARSLLSASIAAAIAFIILVALGSWQLERKVWKESLIETLGTRLVLPPQDIPARETWGALSPSRDEFRRVAFPAEILDDREALVFTAGSAFRTDVSGHGYWVFSPARLAGGSLVVINRGFVPSNLQSPSSRSAGRTTGLVDLVGVLRFPEERPTFAPADDAAKKQFFVRDPQAIACAMGWGEVAPFFIELETPEPPGGWPKPGRLNINLRNNHLGYALTWFGLAASLLVIFAIWSVKRWRAGR